jgi:ribosomal protein S18 acetylase RimI-like enzyme
MLSLACIKGETETWNFKQRVDQLWYKQDIQSLLQVRLQALETGRDQYKRVCRLQVDKPLTMSDQLVVMWDNDRLRDLVSRASQQTGEPNVWVLHNFALAPLDISWLYHLQLSAVDDKGVVIGFCEVALLENPLIETNDSAKGDNITERFAPAITNLAVAADWRRRGVASRLLRMARRYAQIYWKTRAMGLYVEKTNEAAMVLYEREGYVAKTTCDGGARLGPMWYMVCEFDSDGQESRGDEANGESNARVKVTIKAD